MLIKPHQMINNPVAFSNFHFFKYPTVCFIKNVNFKIESL